MYEHSHNKNNMETHFKTLVYNNIYVALDKLEKGIYESHIPVIYPKDMTMDALVNRIYSIKEGLFLFNIDNTFLENLQKCKLIDININQITQPLTKDDVLIAINQCIMNEAEISALIIDKEYPIVIMDDKNITIKSEFTDNHNFSIDVNEESYWGNFFKIKS